MVSSIQNILTKNLETICRVILAKTSQKMIMNLLMMVKICLPICQHHVSGYVCHVWHLRGFFFLLWIEIISIAKLLIIVHFFVWKYEKQTLSYIHTKFEGDRNICGFFLLFFFFSWAAVFLPGHWKLLGPERLMPLKLLGMNSVNTFRTTNETFSFWAWCRQCPQTRNSRSRPVLLFRCSVCGSSCPKLIIRGFPSRGITPEHICVATTYLEQENRVESTIFYPSSSGLRWSVRFKTFWQRI